MSSSASSPAAGATVSTAEEQHRGYHLQAVRVFSHWQVSICPLRETLPFPPSSEELPTAPTSEEAFAKARWRIDRLLEASRLPVWRY